LDCLGNVFYFNIYICVPMTTITQATYKKSTRRKKPNFSRTPAIGHRPQVKGTVSRVTTMTPKKPNSAVRHIAKVLLTNSTPITARMPGRGYWCVKYNRTLVRGGRANDLPGVRYSLIRGKYDFPALPFKKHRRSIYGVSRPEHYTSHIRRCFRHRQRPQQ
jgi:small subunit ribosomal protein S12